MKPYSFHYFYAVIVVGILCMSGTGRHDVKLSKYAKYANNKTFAYKSWITETLNHN